ncbi:MAG: recombinase family protein [bacterium]
MDTTTPTGKLTFNVIATIAEFERDIISERVRAGLQNAKAKGKRLGRPKIPQAKRDKVKKLYQKKLSIWATITKRLKIGVASVARIVKET